MRKGVRKKAASGDLPAATLRGGQARKSDEHDKGQDAAVAPEPVGEGTPRSATAG